jgi:hypothetical protein
VPPQAAAEPKPSAAPRADPPVEATPVAARIASPADAAVEADLGERIRLAAQRAIAAGDREKTAATPPPAKPSVPKPAAAKPAEPMRSAPARKVEMPQPVARKAPEPKIYVPPRAPDDPGPDLVEERDLEIGPLRPSGAKA